MLVARFVFAQQQQMIRLAVQLIDPVEAGAGRHIELAADDGLDPRLFCGLVKIHASVHHAVIGDGDGGLSQLLQPLHQRLDAAGAVEKTELRMQMKMNEGRHAFSSSLSATRRRRRLLRPGRERGVGLSAHSSLRERSG